MEKLPAQMTVIGISKPGGPEVLLPETRAVPAPGPDEILIKGQAAGVNRPDVAQRSGAYPPPPGASDLPGLEIAGEVVAVGSNARKHKIGDKVMSLVAGGGYAQYCIAQDAQAITVPSTLSMTEGGRGAVDPWRLLRHRHHGDPVGQGVRRQGDRHRRLEGKGGCLRQTRGR